MPGGERGLGVCLAMRRLSCTFKYLNIQVGKKVFEEKHLGVVGGRASYLEQGSARVRPAKIVLT